MKSFLQYITEAGIRRKQRLATALERDSWNTQFNADFTSSERSAAIRTARAAETDVKREQARRVPRIVNRAKSEAEAYIPAYVSPEARIERMGDVGSMATEWGKEMLAVKKPGFVQGNDGY